MNKPQKPTPDYPLFAHNNGQWCRKVKGKLTYFGPWHDPQAALLRLQATTANTMKSLPRDDKPAKPRDDFPLFAHASGQWAKKIHGKLYYFGAWADPDAALTKYVEERDDLYAGRGRTQYGDELTIGALCDAYILSKQQRTKTGEIGHRRLTECTQACKRVVKVLGAGRPVVKIRPVDFDKVRADIAKTRGLTRLFNDVQGIRSIFKYAYDSGMIEKPIRFGDFKRPSRRAMRLDRKRRVQENGAKMFTAEDIRRMIDAATNGVKSEDDKWLVHPNQQLLAMIYLGINCGFGNNDCALLRTSNLDLKRGWVEFARPKTGVDRCCPLWPETIKAIEAALAVRPAPKDASNSDRVFVTKYGHGWEAKSDLEKQHIHNPISKAMEKLLTGLGIKRPGVSFYALRHTFQTIAQRTTDKDAVRFLMGHAEAADDMDAVYSEERPSDERLTAVTSAVHLWLIPTDSECAA